LDDDEVEAQVFALPLRCAECGRRWEDPRERWRVYTTDEDPPQSGSYCPECAHREFDEE
jgi:DNA-directed RNA polymerase subunit RPC12/RpoP